MALETVAQKYFSSLNPLASRISTDLNEARDSYEHLWQTLSDAQKRDILNESIIKPEILVKYRGEKEPLEQNYAAKIVVEDNCSYRDEHSGPFSLRTPSQRDLYASFQKQYAQDNSKPEKLEVRQRQVPIEKANKTSRVDDRKYSITLNEENIVLEVTSMLPKTGLDFLDDW